MTQASPLSRQAELGAADDELLLVRSAVLAGDRSTALRILRAFAERAGALPRMPVATAEALVATARGRSEDDPARAAEVARLARVAQARDQVIDLLQQTPFDSADLATIRRVLDALEASARAREEEALRQDVGAAAGRHQVRVGSVWLELKYIPDAASGRTFGPYLYGRWREDGRKWSRYIGKPG